MQPKVLSGQRVVMSINGVRYAFGNVMDYSIDSRVSEIGGVDCAMPVEITPDSLRVTMSLRIFRTIDNDPSTDGKIFQKSTKSPISDQDVFMAKKYITVEVRDRLTDKVMLFLPRAMVMSRNGSVDAEGLMTETWNIISIGFVSVEDVSLVESFKAITGIV